MRGAGDFFVQFSAFSLLYEVCNILHSKFFLGFLKSEKPLVRQQ